MKSNRMRLNRHPLQATFSLILLSVLLLASCAPQSANSDNPQVDENQASSSPQENTVTSTSDALQAATDGVQSSDDKETAVTAETPPQDSTGEEEPAVQEIIMRSVPEDLNWKDQPIMPEISQTAFDVFEYGIASGRNPENISVIGDCQAIPFVFLGKYGLGQYTLDPMDGYLEKMIAFYRASFQREGYAVRGGFTAAAVLSPVRADPDDCKPGETPLDCEWRVHNPSVVFINLETWREEGTVDRYELYLEKIVEYALERGTLPIIIMKADKAESETHVINPAMARVAYQYDIPLINFWRSAQYLENNGIDPEREGFHLSEGGYNLKQTLALRTLYQIWDAELNTEAAEIPVDENSADALPEPTEAPPVVEETKQLALPSFTCQADCVYFDRFTTGPEGVHSEGIFELDLNTQEIDQITPEGVTLQDGLSTPQLFLINQGNFLYLVDRKNETITQLLDNLYPLGGASAYFSSDAATVTAITSKNNKQTIIQIQLIDRSQREIISSQSTPIQLITYRPTDSIYWTSGVCSSQDFCQIAETWVTTLNQTSSTSTLITEKENLIFSPDGSGAAFRDPQYADDINYFHNPIMLYEDVPAGITTRRLFFFPYPGGFMVHPQIASYVFSPDNTKIFVLQDAYSDYFEKSVALHFYVEDLDLRMVFEHGELDGAFGSLSPQVVWSPDNDEILLLLINTTNDREYTFEIYQKDILDRFSNITPIIEPLELENYAYLHTAVWLKDSQ